MRNDSILIAKLLLERKKIEVEKLTKHRAEELLFTAAEHGYQYLARLLLARNDIDVNKYILCGKTPLLMAAQHGHPEAARLLLARKDININKPDKRYGATPLLMAAQHGHPEVARLLLAHNDIDVNKRDKRYGATPLIMAAKYGHPEAARLLLARNDIDVNKPNKKEKKPLFMAVQYGRTKVVQLLLARGADVDIALNEVTIHHNESSGSTHDIMNLLKACTTTATETERTSAFMALHPAGRLAIISHFLFLDTTQGQTLFKNLAADDRISLIRLIDPDLIQQFNELLNFSLASKITSGIAETRERNIQQKRKLSAAESKENGNRQSKEPATVLFYHPPLIENTNKLNTSSPSLSLPVDMLFEISQYRFFPKPDQQQKVSMMATLLSWHKSQLAAEKILANGAKAYEQSNVLIKVSASHFS